MRGIDTQVRKTRRAIFREVANMAYHSANLVGDMEALPYKLVDAENSPYWDNIYRDFSQLFLYGFPLVGVEIGSPPDGRL